MGGKIVNLGTSLDPDSAATVAQLNDLIVAAGNVPAPSSNQIGARLRSTAANVFGWYGGSSDKVNVVLAAGQSNAAGARNGGPNPGNSLVKVWDAVAGAWGSSDITQAPWSYSNPNGNSSNNNIALSFAHRLAEETGKPTYVIFYFVGGTSIDHWVFDGNAGGNGDYYTGLKNRVNAAFATAELAGKTTVDAIIYSQGEEDYLLDFATYLTKFTLLNTQWRAESWMTPKTPIYVTGMSGLHERYQVEKAQQYYCSFVNANTRFVNSRGLQTDYDASGGVGDYTHFQGNSLWEMGYNRIWSMFNGQAVNGKFSPMLFWGRGVGPATIASPQVITSFGSLTSWDSRDRSASAINSLVAATGSISWR